VKIFMPDSNHALTTWLYFFIMWLMKCIKCVSSRRKFHFYDTKADDWRCRQQDCLYSPKSSPTVYKYIINIIYYTLLIHGQRPGQNKIWLYWQVSHVNGLAWFGHINRVANGYLKVMYHHKLNIYQMCNFIGLCVLKFS
jgi:hypothetical protein